MKNKLMKWIKLFKIPFLIQLVIIVLFILVSEVIDLVLIGLILGIILLFTSYILILIKEDKIIKKYEVSSLFFNLNFFINLILSFIIIYFVCFVLMDNNIIFKCSTSFFCLNGIELFLFAFINAYIILLYLILRIIVAIYRSIKLKPPILKYLLIVLLGLVWLALFAYGIVLLILMIV